MKLEQLLKKRAELQKRLEETESEILEHIINIAMFEYLIIDYDRIRSDLVKKGE